MRERTSCIRKRYANTVYFNQYNPEPQACQPAVFLLKPSHVTRHPLGGVVVPPRFCCFRERYSQKVRNKNFLLNAIGFADFLTEPYECRIKKSPSNSKANPKL